MKISLSQIMIVFVLSYATYANDSFAQNILAKSLSLEIKNHRLEDVLTEIEAKAGITIIYSKEFIPLDQMVNSSFRNKKLSYILDNLLKPLNVEYEVIGGQIVLKKILEGMKSSSGLQSLHEDFTALEKIIVVGNQRTVPGAITIKGTVKDSEGQALPGVSIVVKQTPNGTTTDVNGNYTLTVPAGSEVLVFSFIGFITEEISIQNRTDIDVVMMPDISALGEVVVVGYGTQKRQDLTGAVATLSAKAYKDQPVLNASSALQGRVAGVSVTNNSGAPGGAVKIRIRGANSVNASNDPLYVVDGVALSSLGLGDININDIESMEVLKDASATAVYGSRGANGVILITTKKGKSGAAKIEYNGFTSFNRPMKKYDLMDAVTYANIANTTAGVDVFPDPQSYAGKTTDWQSQIFDNSVTQSHQLSANGGSDNARYYVSGFYIGQDGLLIRSNQKKFGIRTNVDLKLSKRINFGLNVYAARVNSKNNDDIGGKGNPVMSSLTWAPTEPVYDSPGQYNRSGVSPIWANPYMVIKERNSESFSNVGVFNGTLKYSITDWLTLNINGGLDMYIKKNAYLGNEWVSPGNNNSGQSSAENYTYQNSNILTFHKTFNKHDITATAVMEATANKQYNLTASGSGLTSLSNGYYNLGLNASQSISSGYSNWSLLSYMGRIAYGFDDRFLLTATIRRDGSSKFQGDNKWSNFPSFSAGWKLSNEQFIKDLNVFSNLKLRAGWGITGNQAVGPYNTLGLLNSTTFSYGTSTLYPAYTLGNPATPDVKWETSKQTNVGLDVGFLNGRVNITADYYDKNTSDLLLFTRINNYDGGGSFLKNIGEVNNRGFELMIEGTPVESKNFVWSTAFNISSNQNKVVSLGADSMIVRPVMGAGLITNNIQVVKVGQPLAAFYLIPWEGVYQTDQDKYKAGDAKYRDVSGNGTVGFEDRVISGSATPKFQWGFSNNVTYKNFELNVFVQGSHGNKIFNATYAATAVPASDVKYITLADAANYWTPTNTSSTWANPGSKNKSWVESTQFLQDGSYVRLKNISLSYQIGQNLLKVASAKVYVSAQNIATITKYKGFDPEASSTRSDSDVDSGIDLGAYPSPKTFTVGLQLKF